MNQPELSRITFLASLNVLRHRSKPEEAFEASVRELCSPGFGRFLLEHRKAFFETGLDALGPEEKERFLRELTSFSDSAAREIEHWLQGGYVVGAECLTD